MANEKEEKFARTKKIKKRLYALLAVVVVLDVILLCAYWLIPEPEVKTSSPIYDRVLTVSEQVPMTKEQLAALTRGLEYLESMPFSRNGLVKQLISENYSPEDAAFAANYCGADWNEQAILRACEYIDSMPFSYKGLVQQLEYDGFTHDEAKYGVSKCGADWNEQAASKAKSYTELLSFTRDQLVDQLVSDGFTKEQARYGAHQVLK